MNADKNFNRRNVLVLEKLDVYAAMDYDCEEKIFADLRHQSTTLKAKSTERSRKQWASTRQTQSLTSQRYKKDYDERGKTKVMKP